MGKRKRDSTAAYAASQPLFSALKVGCEKLDEQSRNLSTARDLVQNLHVKLDQLRLDGAGTHSDVDDHDQYTNSILAAWQIAADTYRTVFAELVNITAAQPDEGKAALDSHNGFKSMLQAAANASNMTKTLVDERAKGKAIDAGSGAKQLNPKRKATNEEFNAGVSESQPVKRLRKSAGAEDKDEKPMREQEVPRHRSNNGKLEKAAKRRKKNAPAEDDASDTAPRLPDAQQETQNTSKTFVKDGVRYEDVSAEVAARLKAKGDRLKAAKAEERKKKRKRKSSDPSATVIGNEPGSALVDRPSKKKSKKGLAAQDHGAVKGASEPVESHDTHDKGQAKVADQSKRPGEDSLGAPKKRKKTSITQATT